MGQGCRRHGTNLVRTCSASSPVALPTWCQARYKSPPATCLFIIYNYCMHVFLHTYACGCAWWGWDSHRMFAGVRGQLLWNWSSPSILLVLEMRLMSPGFHYTHSASSHMSSSDLCSCLPGALLGIETLPPHSWPQQIPQILPPSAPYWNVLHKFLGFCILNRGLM